MSHTNHPNPLPYMCVCVLCVCVFFVLFPSLSLPTILNLSMSNSDNITMGKTRPTDPVKVSFPTLSLLMCWDRSERNKDQNDQQFCSVSEMKEEAVMKIIRAEIEFVKTSSFDSVIADSRFFHEGQLFDQLMKYENSNVIACLVDLLKAMMDSFLKKVESLDSENKEKDAVAIKQIISNFSNLQSQPSIPISDLILNLKDMFGETFKVHNLFVTYFLNQFIKHFEKEFTKFYSYCLNRLIIPRMMVTISSIFPQSFSTRFLLHLIQNLFHHIVLQLIILMLIPLMLLCSSQHLLVQIILSLSPIITSQAR